MPSGMLPRPRSVKPQLQAETLSLEEWLSHVLIPKECRKVDVYDYQFPTDKHREEFLETISTRSELDVRALLRNFLITNGSLVSDDLVRAWLRGRPPEELVRKMAEHEFYRRAMHPPFLPWEGVTWVLDLLPDSPSKALDVLSAYFTAHCLHMPDGRMVGLIDAEAIIRQRYLHWENPRDSLLSLHPNEFEHLIAALYTKMGYDATATKKSRDGGIDVEARGSLPGLRGLVLIQCKRYEDVVRVQAVRELMGVVSRRQANKGIIVATCGFTRPAQEEADHDPMIELVNFSTLNNLLNRYLGAKWPQRISYEIRNQQMKSAKKIDGGVG